MSGVLQIGLRAGDKIYINGAVVRVDRKVRLELLNDATFLLGSHVLQLEDATTPLRQVYFLIQGILMDPRVRANLLPAIEAAVATQLTADIRNELRDGLAQVVGEVRSGNTFGALKALRALLPLEQGAECVSEQTAPAHMEVA